MQSPPEDKRRGVARRYKYLRGVAHDIAASFTSMMNYEGGDYVMSHLLRSARETRLEALEFTVSAGGVDLRPAALVTHPVRTSLERVSRLWVPKAALETTIALRFDLARERPLVLNSSDATWVTSEVPFRCVVRITDDRGKQWSNGVVGWWWSDPP